MGFKNILGKVRRALLCAKHERKPSLDIGLPTDVRRVDISDALPGLTETERRNIREKAPSDVIHLLGLQSHPSTSPPSPTGSTSPFSVPSHEPSEALLNAASKDLPSVLPTPPRRTHNESSPPAIRLQNMRTHALNSLESTLHNDFYEKLDKIKDSQDQSDMAKSSPTMTDSFMTLNLEFDWEEKSPLPDTPRTLSLYGDAEGFEPQSTTGGTPEANSPVAATKAHANIAGVKSQKAVDSSFGDSDSDFTENYAMEPHSPLVTKL